MQGHKYFNEEVRCGKFLKPCNGNDRRGGEESSFFDGWDWRHEQSDILVQVDSWAQNVPKSVSSAKGCLSVNFPMCVKNYVFHDQQLSITAPQYDISREGECRPDEVPIEVAPSEEWLLDEVELNTVTISNMSIDSKSVETGGERG